MIQIFQYTKIKRNPQIHVAHVLVDLQADPDPDRHLHLQELVINCFILLGNCFVYNNIKILSLPVKPFKIHKI
jgi:hypothetical protein